MEHAFGMISVMYVFPLSLKVKKKTLLNTKKKKNKSERGLPKGAEKGNGGGRHLYSMIFS
jgi:hypothetical protein